MGEIIYQRGDRFGDDETAVTVRGTKRVRIAVAVVPTGMENVRYEDRLSAFATFSATPSVPPHDKFTSWDAYAHWISTAVMYREQTWELEHRKFVSSSSAGRYLGLGSVTPEGERIRGYSDAPRSRMLCYIMERGYCLEFLHAELFRIFCDTMRLTRCDHSHLHPTERWIMATPDAFLSIGDRVVALAEFKTHVTDAHHTVDPVHMCQMQIAMQVANVDRCYYSSLSVDDRTLESEWIVVLVRRSDEYWRRALPPLRRFARAFLLRNAAPRRDEFEAPYVPSEMVLARRNVLDCIGPDAATRIADALALAHRGADEAFERETAMAAMRASHFDNTIDTFFTS